MNMEISDIKQRNVPLTKEGLNRKNNFWTFDKPNFYKL